MKREYRHASQRSESAWSNAIYELVEKLERLRDTPPSARRERLREDFYELFLKLTGTAAWKTLRERSWRGDCYHDSEDIGSLCARILLKQEKAGKGVFDSGKVPAGAELRGYLNRTIWRGVSQGIINLLRKDRCCITLDVSIFSVTDRAQDAQSLWQDVETVRSRLSARVSGRFRTFTGKTPVDGVIAKALADAGERKLHLEARVPKRTWQREEQAAREELRESLRSSPIWSRGRQDACRRITRHRDPDL
jgi:hypothetical protein